MIVDYTADRWDYNPFHSTSYLFLPETLKIEICRGLKITIRYLQLGQCADSGKISAGLMFKSVILPLIQEWSVQKPYAYFEPITINLLVITILIIDFILTF